MSDLKYHWTNPKFEGKSWAVDRKPKPKKKSRKKYHKNKAKLKNPHAQECLLRLPKFWDEFRNLPNSAMRIECLRRWSRPPWKRVSEELRLRLRRQFGNSWSRFLKNIDDYCGVCGNAVWKEKHHIIPLCYGGINNDWNLIAICLACHDAIHPWLKELDNGKHNW